MKAMACALLLTALLTGCAHFRSAEPSASPATDPNYDRVACQQSGGKWNSFTRNCDR